MTSGKGGTVFCEELTDYRMTPSSDGSQDQLLRLDGRLRVERQVRRLSSLKEVDSKGGVTADKDAVSVEIGGDSADRDMVENMRKDLMHGKSKDGIDAHLFPFTTKEQDSTRSRWWGRSG